MLGDLCKIEEDCSATIDNSTCEDGSCLCLSGFAQWHANTTCIKRKHFTVIYPSFL